MLVAATCCEHTMASPPRRTGPLAMQVTMQAWPGIRVYAGLDVAPVREAGLSRACTAAGYMAGRIVMEMGEKISGGVFLGDGGRRSALTPARAAALSRSVGPG